MKWQFARYKMVKSKRFKPGISPEMVYKHSIAWAIFISYEVLFVYMTTNSFANFWDYAIHYVLNILFFYFTAHVIFAYAFKSEKPYILLSLLLPIELLIFVGLKYIIDTIAIAVGLPFTDIGSSVKIYIILNAWRGIYFIGLSTAYWAALSSLKHWKRSNELAVLQIQKQKTMFTLEQNLIKSKNAYLQAQINAHLLFNTLNFVYNSVRKASAPAADSITLLSEIMRYSITEIQEDGKVELLKEINHMKNFVKLNQLRFNNSLNIRVNFAGNVQQKRIIPLLLMTFVENIIKHGHLTDKDHPAKLNLTVEGNHLFFHTFNIKKKNIFISSRGHSIGISNAKSRLASDYKDRHTLSIQESENEFIVDLKLQLNG